MGVLVVLLAFPFVGEAQEKNWEAVLDSYELICAQCAQYRTVELNGGVVPHRKIQTLSRKLKDLQRQLQDAGGAMSAEQRARFEAIRRSYLGTAIAEPQVANEASTGDGAPSKIATVHPQSLPHKAASSSMAPVTTMPSGSAPEAETAAITKKSTPRIFPIEVKRYTIPQPLPGMELPSADTVPLLHPGVHTVLAYAGSAPGFGLMAAFRKWNGWGAFVRGSWNFGTAPYSIASSSDDNTLWASGQSRALRWSVTAGAIIPLIRPGKLPEWENGSSLSLYAGAGWGCRRLTWEDVSGAWALIGDRSASSVALDAGLIFNIRRFALTAGIGTIAFRYPSAEFGAGISF